PLKNNFVEHGLKLEDLNAAVQNLESAIRAYAEGKAIRSGAIREFDKTLEEAEGYLQRLDVLVANTLQGNAAVMASWELARRVERAGSGKRNSSHPKPQPPPVTPASSKTWPRPAP